MVEERATEDLTARARIRDAALRLFAERGVDGATIRDIAAEAGVSLGLVRHHFGAKEALRAACDEYVSARSRELLFEATKPGTMPSPGFLPEVHPTIVLLVRYLARSMSDGTAAASAMFDDGVALTEQWMERNHPNQFDDPRAVAVMVAAMQFGPLLMHNLVSAALGTDLLSREGHIRSTKAYIEIYRHSWLTEDAAQAAKAAYDRLEEGETS
jgi:AcrR family transcriptional regulator